MRDVRQEGCGEGAVDAVGELAAEAGNRETSEFGADGENGAI